MLSQAEFVKDIEARAARAGITVKDLCKAARVHRNTWQRYKDPDRQGAYNIMRRMALAIRRIERKNGTVAP